MKQDSKRKYLCFTDFYNSKDAYQGIADLYLTPVEGFELRDVADIDMYKGLLTNLKRLIISDNLISKINLKNFNNLSEIMGPRNMISEVNLVLSRLTHLDLNSNMLSKLFDLSNLPMLHTLNLNHNLIEKVHIKDLLPAKKSLHNLYLAYNKIKMDANEFIALIEGLKVFHLDSFSFEGNKFILENKSLTHNYKTFIVASMPSLISFNDQEINLKRETLNANEIMLQILSEERENKMTLLGMIENFKEMKKKDEDLKEQKKKQPGVLEEQVVHQTNPIGRMFMSVQPGKNHNNNFAKTENIISKMKTVKDQPLQKKEKDDLNLLEKLKKINEIFEELNSSNGTTQSLFLELMSKINTCVSGIVDENLMEKNIEEIEEEFATFIINCHMLIELNSNLEEPIYKVIAQFALFYQGQYFVEKSFEFFHSLITGSNNKMKNITKIIDSVIISQIKENKDFPNFKIVDAIIQFYRSFHIKCTELYLALIPTIVNHLISCDVENLYTCNDRSEDKVKNMETCLDFIRQYFKIDFPEQMIYEEKDDKYKQSQYNKEEDLDLDFDVVKSEESDFVSTEEFIIRNSKSSEELFELEYGFKLREFEDRSNISLEENKDDEISDVDHDETIKEEEKADNKTVPKKSKENVLKIEEITINNQIFKEILEQNIFNYTDNSLEEKREKYIFIFIHAFRKCSLIVNYIDTIFQDKNEKFRKLFVNSIKLLITLTKRFEYYNELYELNSDCRKNLIKVVTESKVTDSKASDYNSQDSTIIAKLTKFLRTVIWIYVNDISQFEYHVEEVLIKGNKEEDKLIMCKSIERTKTKENKNITKTNINEEYMSKTKLTEKINSFKFILIKILNCYGGILRTCDEYTFKNEIEKETPSDILKILIAVKNDPFVLTGACKFMSQILSNKELQCDNMALSKVLNKVLYLTVLLRYINSTDSSYKGVFDKISQFYGITLNTKSLDPYSYENISSHNMKYMIKLFLSIINLFKIIAHISLIRGPLTMVANVANKSLADNKLHEYLGNCLKIKNDALRKLSVECIYYYDHHNLKNEVIDQIIIIISNYTSVTDGETEIILSTIYVILTNIILSMQKNQENESRFSLIKALKMAFEFINKNSDRSPTQEDEVEQKNILGISLILFVNIASKFSEFNQVLKLGIDNFRTILYFDYLNFTPEYYLPIEIERTKLGSYLSILLEITRSDSVISPFSYPFIRVMIKIADVLSNCEEFTYSIDYSKDMNNLIDKVSKEIRTRICYRFTNEKISWYDFVSDTSQWLNEEKPIKDILREIEINNKKITQINDGELLKIEDTFSFDYKKMPVKMMEEMQKEEQRKANTFGSSGSGFQGGNTAAAGSTFKLEQKMYNFTKKDNKQEKVREKDKSISSYYANKDNDKKFKPCPLHKLLLEELIKEQVNFTAYFSNLMLFLFGLTSNLHELEISKQLKEKFDPALINSEKIIKLLKEENSSSENFTDSFISPQILKRVKPSLLSDNNELKDENRDEKLKMYMGVCNNNIFKDIFDKNINDFFYNFHENDLDEYQEYGMSINQKRIAEEETVHNPHLRSLLVSSLLRSIYSILISPSKDVTSHFLEILFIDDKWKNLIMLIDSTQIFEYNIAHKALNIFERIFNKQRINYLFKTMTVYIGGNSSKIVNEEKLFHSFYVFTVFFEKMLYYYNNRFFKLEKFDFLFIRDLTITFNNFMACLLEYKFTKIKESFVQFHIYKKIIKEDYIDIILYCSRSLKFLKKKTVKKIQNFLHTQIAVKKDMIFINNINVSKEYSDLEYSVSNHLINYVFDLEKTLRTVEDLLAMFMLVYPPCKNYILEKMLNVNYQQEKVIHNMQLQKVKNEKRVDWKNLINTTIGTTSGTSSGFNETSNSKDQIILDKLNSLNERKKRSVENLIKSQNFILNITNLKQNLFKNSLEDQILFFEVCEYYDLITKDKSFVTCLLTNREIIIIKLHNSDLNEESLISNNFCLKEPLLKIKISDFKLIFLYDYTNRLLFKFESQVFSLVFLSYLNVKILLDNLKFFNPNLKLITYNSISSLISKTECENPYTQRKLRDHEIIRDKNSEVKSSENENITERNYAELKRQYDDILKEFKIDNNIYNNFYKQDLLPQPNTFLVSNDYMTFMDYVTYLWRDEGLLIREKKVVFISKFYLYLLKEKFEKIDNTPKEDYIFDNSCFVESGGVFEIVLQIRLENIVVLEKKDENAVRIAYRADDEDTISELLLYFKADFEFISFHLKLDAAVKDILDEEVVKKYRQLRSINQKDNN